MRQLEDKAKKDVLAELLKMIEDSEGKDINSVQVSAPDEKGLEEGLAMASDIIKKSPRDQERGKGSSREKHRDAGDDEAADYLSDTVEEHQTFKDWQDEQGWRYEDLDEEDSSTDPTDRRLQRDLRSKDLHSAVREDEADEIARLEEKLRILKSRGG